MSAVLVQVADAVVELLNTPDAFSQKFMAKRSYPTWKIPLSKLGPLRVEVVPSSHYETDFESQESENYGCRILIVIRKKFGSSDRLEESSEGTPISDEAIDALVLFVEEVFAYLASYERRILKTPNGVDFAAWADTSTIQNTYVHDHLQDNFQFTGLIRVDYGTTVEL